MRKLLFTIFTCLCLLSNITYANDNNIINKAYHNKQSDIQVQGIGKVIKVLKDDTKGSKHQRFLVKLPSGLTILIAHNIDLSPRVQNLKSGDSIEFYGEYEWNNKGGVIHWTHHDPRKKHKDGWIKHKQIVYK
uniref:DUF3465 domain-containing protein n=1 Tax=Aliarcobacter sp. TaxID=2321116 RepID=UPI0040477B76